LANLRKSLVDSYARSTATITLHYAATVMRAAHRMRRVPRDITQTLDPPRNRSGKSDTVTPDDLPTRAEVVAIMEATDNDWRAAVSLGASGLRVSEVLGVHVEQYDHATGVLTVDRQLQRIDGVDSFPLPKRDKVRSIVLPDWARADLEHAIARQGSDLVFRSRLGEPRRRDVFYSSVWRPALVAAGLDERAYKFHSLRHWCASSMLAEGVPVTAVAGHLGDTLETLSRTYAHWLRDDRDVPAAALSRMLRPTLAVVEAV
jgi:integrase